MPPPTAPPHSSPEKGNQRENPSEEQAGNVSDHTYEYGEYQYDGGQYSEGAGLRAGGFQTAQPPALPPGRMTRPEPSAPAREGETIGSGARSRRPQLGTFQDRDFMPRGHNAEFSGGPKNLGALREVLNYDPDREDRGGVTVRDFLESAAGAASLGHLDGRDLMQVMPMRLQGAAKAFYRTFMESKGLNETSPRLGNHWGEFKEALKDRFRKSTDSVTTLLNLANCRQGDKESVRAYAQRVKTMAIKLWPALLQSQDPSNQNVAKTLVYQHFQKGLRPNMLEYLNLKDINDMDQAVNELSRKETFDQAQKERFGGQVNMISESPSAAEAKVAQLQEQMSDLTTTVSAYMAETTELVRGQMAAMSASLQHPNEQIWDGHHAGPNNYGDQAEYLPYDDSPEYPDWSHPTFGNGHELVNAVQYQPRLPQYPIIRPPLPTGQNQYGPRGGCNYCGGPHMWRFCPHLPYQHTYASGVPYQTRLPQPGARAGYPARPPRPTGAFPPRAMWRGTAPNRHQQPPNPWQGVRGSNKQPTQALNENHRL